MFVSAFAAMALLAAPESVQAAVPAPAPAPEAKSTEAKAAPKKMCYTATPSGSRMPRKVCVTQSGGVEKAAEKQPKAE
ncbi:hypothetical protein [Phenylobacterium sp.]|uniref:hypothetical protein n=1 Tax=Phenylobacterium sp. TaxID=1871053 RepID=UPI003BA8EDC8